MRSLYMSLNSKVELSVREFSRELTSDKVQLILDEQACLLCRLCNFFDFCDDDNRRFWRRYWYVDRVRCVICCRAHRDIIFFVSRFSLSSSSSRRQLCLRAFYSWVFRERDWISLMRCNIFMRDSRDRYCVVWDFFDEFLTRHQLNDVFSRFARLAKSSLSFLSFCFIACEICLTSFSLTSWSTSIFRSWITVCLISTSLF